MRFDSAALLHPLTRNGQDLSGPPLRSPERRELLPGVTRRVTSVYAKADHFQHGADPPGFTCRDLYNLCIIIANTMAPTQP
jgi:hypothetical protein